MNYQNQTGFNLLELMTAITVLAVLLGLGIPSFTQTMRNNRISAQTNALVSALNLAKNEAGRRGIPTAVCPAKPDFSNCSGANNWNNGWIIFVDTPGTAPGIIDGADLNADPPPPLQVWPALTGGTAISDPGIPLASVPAFVSFNADGSTSLIQNGGFKVSHPSCTGQNARTIVVNKTNGRISSAPGACP